LHAAIERGCRAFPFHLDLSSKQGHWRRRRKEVLDHAQI
jgi:hypothetical protein